MSDTVIPHSSSPGASRTTADLVLARDNAARRSHRAAAMSVVAIRGACILVALSGFLQSARSGIIIEGGKATGRLQTGWSRVLESFHLVVCMEWMARVVEGPPTPSDKSVGQWRTHRPSELWINQHDRDSSDPCSKHRC